MHAHWGNSHIHEDSYTMFTGAHIQQENSSLVNEVVVGKSNMGIKEDHAGNCQAGPEDIIKDMKSKI